MPNDTSSTPRDGTACLLLHGFSGSPFEMRPLADGLEARGWNVSVPRLPGHAETVEAFVKTGFADWLEAATEEYELLASRFERVVLVGLSMGGSLSLKIAQERDPAGVVCLAAPVFFYRFFPSVAGDWRLSLTWLLKRFRPLVPMPPHSRESQEIAPWQGYEEVMAMEPLHSLIMGLREVRAGLERVRAPLLVLHAPGDRLVSEECAWEIVRRVSSRERTLRLLPIEETVTSRHVLTTHRETRDLVLDLVADFVGRCAAEANGPLPVSE